MLEIERPVLEPKVQTGELEDTHHDCQANSAGRSVLSRRHGTGRKFALESMGKEPAGGLIVGDGMFSASCATPAIKHPWCC